MKNNISKIAVLGLVLAACAPSPASDGGLGEMSSQVVNLPNPTTPFTLAAGNNNNYRIDPTFTMADLVPNASGSTITGIDRTGYSDGDMIVVRNHSATVPVTFTNQDALSLANNRLVLPGSFAILLQPRQAMFLAWDGNASGFVPVLAGGAGSVASVLSVNASPGRTLSTVFQPSATNDVQVYYSIQMDTSLSLVTGAWGEVSLFCDTTATPTTLVMVVGPRNTGTLTVGLALQGGGTFDVHYRVPRGSNCRMVPNNVVGTPVFTLRAQLEEVLAN